MLMVFPPPVALLCMPPTVSTPGKAMTRSMTSSPRARVSAWVLPLGASMDTVISWLSVSGIKAVPIWVTPNTLRPRRPITRTNRRALWERVQPNRRLYRFTMPSNRRCLVSSCFLRMVLDSAGTMVRAMSRLASRE